MLSITHEYTYGLQKKNHNMEGPVMLCYINFLCSVCLVESQNKENIQERRISSHQPGFWVNFRHIPSSILHEFCVRLLHF